VVLADERPNGELLLSRGELQDANPADFLLFKAELLQADKYFVMKQQVGAPGASARRVCVGAQGASARRVCVHGAGARPWALFRPVGLGWAHLTPRAAPLPSLP
jgi:hypothetical protein